MSLLKSRWNLLCIQSKIRFRNFLENEEGDTNFISIAIILMIVIAVALVFMTFKDEIIETLEEQKDNLINKLKGQKTEINKTVPKPT